jgi:hypothetical protein
LVATVNPDVSFGSLKVSGLLRAVALPLRSGATFAVAVAPLLMVQKNDDGSADTFSPGFWLYRYF